MELLKTLCDIHAPSGNEVGMKNFLLKYIEENKSKWKVQPEIIQGDNFQDNILLVFGKPRTVIFAHVDSIGFTVRYGKQLVKIGGPQTKNGYIIKGKDSKGDVECELKVEKDSQQGLSYILDRELETGTELTFKMNFRDSKDYIQSCYLDNRLGVWSALQVAKTLENGIIAFSCYEEHAGGNVEYIANYIYNTYKVKQALISDITWITEGVQHGKGVVISMRDSGIPRRSYINKIIELAKTSGIDFQLEVEATGGSDGNALQRSPYPFDWCFIGAPEDNVHTPDEKVHKDDIASMVALYKELMEKL